jgi:hypothetical protein
MDRDRNSERLKEYLENYLLKKGLDLRHNFPCLNPEHADSNTPSMAYWKGHNKVRCFGQCDRTFDLFDIIGFDYGISDFLEQLEIAERLYGKGENLTSANENKRLRKRPLRLLTFPLSIRSITLNLEKLPTSQREVLVQRSRSASPWAMMRRPRR